MPNVPLKLCVVLHPKNGSVVPAPSAAKAEWSIIIALAQLKTLLAGMHPIPDRSEHPAHNKADHGSDNDQRNRRHEVESRDRIWRLNEVEPENPVDNPLRHSDNAASAYSRSNQERFMVTLPRCKDAT
jgi:hypothetical protein